MAAVPPPEPSPLTFLGAAVASSDRLAESLRVGTVRRGPDPPPDGGWEARGDDVLRAWRAELAALPTAEAVVVCTWSEPTPAVRLHELEPEQWRAQVEWPSALWFTTLVAAAERCRDGGAVVAVVERPATIDAPARAPLVAVGDGLVNLMRSLAAIEGPRGVRVNAVTTGVHTAPEVLLGAPPRLTTFPGRVEVEVAGAVRLLLSPDAAGVTGTTLAADCGRG